MLVAVAIMLALPFPPRFMMSALMMSRIFLICSSELAVSASYKSSSKTRDGRLPFGPAFNPRMPDYMPRDTIVAPLVGMSFPSSPMSLAKVIWDAVFCMSVVCPR